MAAGPDIDTETDETEDALPVPPQVGETLKRFEEVLRAAKRVGRTDPKHLASVLGRVPARRISDPQFMALLRRRFEQEDCREVLLELLLRTPAETFSSVHAAGVALVTAARLGRSAEVEDIMAAQRAGGAEARFGVLDYINRFHPIPPASIFGLAALKYAPVADDPREGFVERARAMMPRIDPDPRLVAALFPHRDNPRIHREAWVSRVRFACAADHIFQDAITAGFISGRAPVPEYFSRDVYESTPLERAREITSVVPRDRGVLFSTFHAGHLTMVRLNFQRIFETGIQIQRSNSAQYAPGMISIADNPRAALFSALRMIEDGGQLLMAPDGHWGESRLAISVLGHTLDIGEGAAFLAYESGCYNAFLTYVFDGGVFVPRVVEGPQKLPGEKYRAYRQRWAQFYAREIERIFTGRPENIAFRNRWFGVFARRPRAPAAG
ncbi:hypothetical protein FDP22_22005 (plasmid) [Paroceanicella profunda]|uniref:Uncharacterized protein n=1 Tax=Paroceanicella profunda TaxID=2579971 RepID=A0A5B8G370_9RHOB|nr:hypothetical protein [Paroceanicella profunda]QDL94554.1 hypothetical protein FDP22_22005 [Paroceanicella profunda]